MSQFSDAIREIQTGVQRPVPMGRIKVEALSKADISAPLRRNTLVRYVIELEAQTWISTTASKDEALAAHRAAKRMLIHAMFGEFHEPIMKLDYELRYGDPEEAAKLLAALKAQMFEGLWS